jgi:hypothetical protein
MNMMRKPVSVLILTILALGLATSLGYANSAPPPSAVWFYFDLPGQSPSGGGTPFVGLQLLGCEDMQCAAPALLKQTGRCDLPGCLAGPPLPPASGSVDQSRLECFGNRCRSQSYAYPRPYFRLAMQPIGSGVLLFSSVHELPQGYAHYQYWRVTVENGQLTLTPTEALETPSAFSQPFFGCYLLTLLSELAVAALIWFWQLRGRLGLPRLLLMVGLATSLTYPAVYLSPALAPFARAGERQLFYRSLGGSFFIACLFWLLFAAVIWPARVDGHPRPSNRWRWVIGLIIGAVLVVCVLAYPLFMFGASYAASYRLAAVGLPVLAAIGLAELYAFGLEAACYRLWSRGDVGWRYALLLSLLANLASFGLGILLQQISTLV